jgi:hypothetical protein
MNLVDTNDNSAQSWYKEIKDYDFANPNDSTGVIGHFTQMVWKNSQTLGCGWAGE